MQICERRLWFWICLINGLIFLLGNNYSAQGIIYTLKLKRRRIISRLRYRGYKVGFAGRSFAPSLLNFPIEKKAARNLRFSFGLFLYFDDMAVETLESSCEVSKRKHGDGSDGTLLDEFSDGDVNYASGVSSVS